MFSLFIIFMLNLYRRLVMDLHAKLSDLSEKSNQKEENQNTNYKREHYVDLFGHTTPKERQNLVISVKLDINYKCSQTESST